MISSEKIIDVEVISISDSTDETGISKEIEKKDRVAVLTKHTFDWKSAVMKSFFILFLTLSLSSSVSAKTLQKSKKIPSFTVLNDSSVTNPRDFISRVDYRSEKLKKRLKVQKKYQISSNSSFDTFFQGLVLTIVQNELKIRTLEVVNYSKALNVSLPLVFTKKELALPTIVPLSRLNFQKLSPLKLRGGSNSIEMFQTVILLSILFVYCGNLLVQWLNETENEAENETIENQTLRVKIIGLLDRMLKFIYAHPFLIIYLGVIVYNRQNIWKFLVSSNDRQLMTSHVLSILRETKTKAFLGVQALSQIIKQWLGSKSDFMVQEKEVEREKKLKPVSLKSPLSTEKPKIDLLKKRNRDLPELLKGINPTITVIEDDTIIVEGTKFLTDEDPRYPNIVWDPDPNSIWEDNPNNENSEED